MNIEIEQSIYSYVRYYVINSIYTYCIVEWSKF